MGFDYLNSRDYDTYSDSLLKTINNLKLKPPEGMTGCFDWLSCTFNCYHYKADNDFTYAELTDFSLEEFRKLLFFFDRENTPLNSFERLTGAEGFKYRIEIFDGVTILFYGPTTLNGTPATKLNISGKGCASLIKSGKFIGLLKYCLDNAYRFTRFDSAIDNYTDIMNLEHINNLVVARCYTSCFKKPFRITGTPNPNSPYGYDGVTYYLGNSSDLLLRIYAKNWEQEEEKFIENWVRWEVQLRDHERIKQLIILIILGYERDKFHNYFNIVASLLNEIVTFRVPSNDSNKSRWPVDPEWKKFLNEVDSIKLFAAAKSKSTFETSFNWFSNNCSLFLTQLLIVFGEKKFFRFIKFLVFNRFSNFTESDFNVIIEQYKKENRILNRTDIHCMFSKLYDEIVPLEFDDNIKVSEELINEEIKELELKLEKRLYKILKDKYKNLDSEDKNE